MQLVCGWLGGILLFAGVCAFVISFHLMTTHDVFPREMFPDGWWMARYGAYFGTSLSLLTGFGLAGVWVSHLGAPPRDKKEG